MRDGHLDQARFQTTVGALVDAASKDGSLPLLVFGEMVALLWADGQVNAALELESAWNALADTRAFTLLCAYPTAVLHSGTLADLDHVAALHSTLQAPSATPHHRSRRSRWTPTSPANVARCFCQPPKRRARPADSPPRSWMTGDVPT